jgi:sugar phosphate isomerase/epimerase
LPLDNSKIAVSWYSLLYEWQHDNASLSQLFDFSEEAGADGVELLDAFLYPKGVSRDYLLEESSINDASTVINQYRGRLLSVAVSNGFEYEDFARLSVERKKIAQGAKLASAGNASLIRVFIGNPTSPEAIDLCRYRAIDAFKDLNRDSNITYAIENHGPTFSTPERLESVLSPLKEAPVGVCFDVGNWLLAGVDARIAAEQLPAPALIHVKDFRPDGEGPYANRQGEKFAGCRLGEGVVPIIETLQILHQKSENTPTIVVELECGPDGRDASIHAVSWLRETLSQI